MSDIRRYIRLIESIQIDESFKLAKERFSQDHPSDEVDHYLNQFRDLTKRNIIKGPEKDISRWINSEFNEFQSFIDDKSKVLTKKQEKKKSKKDAITVYEDEDMMVIIPLSEKSSCIYGKNTKWCTAATKSDNKFDEYFIRNGITLFYVLMDDGDKLAAAVYPEHKQQRIEYFNSNDDSISESDFQAFTDISPAQLRKWADEYNTQLNKVRVNQISMLNDDELEMFIMKTPELFLDVPKEKVNPRMLGRALTVAKDNQQDKEYIDKIINHAGRDQLNIGMIYHLVHVYPEYADEFEVDDYAVNALVNKPLNTVYGSDPENPKDQHSVNPGDGYILGTYLKMKDDLYLILLGSDHIINVLRYKGNGDKYDVSNFESINEFSSGEARRVIYVIMDMLSKKWKVFEKAIFNSNVVPALIPYLDSVLSSENMLAGLVHKKEDDHMIYSQRSI